MVRLRGPGDCERAERDAHQHQRNQHDGEERFAFHRTDYLGGCVMRQPAVVAYFGPSGTNSASNPSAWNHATIARCGGTSVP